MLSKRVATDFLPFFSSPVVATQILSDIGQNCWCVLKMMPTRHLGASFPEKYCVHEVLPPYHHQFVLFQRIPLLLHKSFWFELIIYHISHVCFFVVNYLTAFYASSALFLFRSSCILSVFSSIHLFLTAVSSFLTSLLAALYSLSSLFLLVAFRCPHVSHFSSISLVMHGFLAFFVL